MRYFCTFLIIFLSACSPAPVQRAPANSLSEADDLAYRDDLTPKEKPPFGVSLKFKQSLTT